MMKIRLERERLEIGNVCVCLPGVRITVCERDSVCVCVCVCVYQSQSLPSSHFSISQLPSSSKDASQGTSHRRERDKEKC